jgi:hypothetical protein
MAPSIHSGSVDKRVLLASLALWTSVSCRGPEISLAEDLEAERDYSEGRYASFLDAPSDRGLVRLSEDSRPSLTPPFPGRLRFTLRVPESAVLSFAPALVVRQEVRRADVEFVVLVDSEAVYREFFDFEDANQWNDREVDLSRFSGREIALTLETRAIGGRGGKLWADRLQTVWGNPALASNRLAGLRYVSAGEATRLGAFAVHLALGGVLALLIRFLFVRYGTAPGDRARLANLFPLLTIATIVVLTVVQVSIPLSLGLLGALSIVRFRTAIKTPEELVYVLFCVALGLTLGAQHRLLAIAGVAVTGAFVLLRHRFDGPAAERSFLLSISGDAGRFFGGSVLNELRGMAPRLELQRLDCENGRVEMRTFVAIEARDVESFLARVRAAFPGFEVACVASDAVL